ncbi:MAG: hypothetical protein ACI4XE_02680, partial [Acutalibacteraceae bacterium]
MTERAKREKSLKTANYNILIVAICSAVNVLLYLINSNTSFLFSAFAPTLAMDFGYVWSEESGSGSYYTLSIVAAVLIVLFYLAVFLIGRKKPGAIIAALVAFAVDTVILLFCVFVLIEKEYITDYLFDIAFHAWVMFYCISGTAAYSKLRKLPADAQEEPAYGGEFPLPADMTPQSEASKAEA